MGYIGIAVPNGMIFCRFGHKQGIDLAIVVINRIWFKSTLLS